MKKIFLATFLMTTILLAACAPQAATPTASAPSAPSASGTETKVNISGFAFDPGTITIKVGDTVTWTNKDSVGHTVVADDGSWTSTKLGNGATYSHTFDTAGTFTYICSVHPTMTGTVVVQP